MADGKERKPKSFRIDDSTIKCEEEAGIAGRATSHAEASNSHRTVASNKNYAQGIKSQGKGKYKAEKAIVFSLATIEGHSTRQTINMYLEKENCICYNASRQKVMTFHVDERSEPPNCVTAQFGGSSFFYSGKAPTRLFVVLMAVVKPFDDVVAGYTSRNSD